MKRVPRGRLATSGPAQCVQQLSMSRAFCKVQFDSDRVKMPTSLQLHFSVKFLRGGGGSDSAMALRKNEAVGGADYQWSPV